MSYGLVNISAGKRGELLDSMGQNAREEKRRKMAGFDAEQKIRSGYKQSGMTGAGAGAMLGMAGGPVGIAAGATLGFVGGYLADYFL